MIIKRRHTKAFVTLENALVRDRRLSLDEHGMLHYLLSLPDDWEVSRANCAKFWGIGRDKAARIFRKLRQCGWAQVERVHGEDGTFLGVRWIITDEPGAEVSEADLDQDADDDSDGDEATQGGDAAHHDTENPEHGSPVARVTRSTEKAYDGLYIDSKKTDSEENRIPQTGARENAVLQDSDAPSTFTDLVKLWPSDHVLSRVAAEQAWQRMPKLVRQKAHDVAPRYLDDCRRNNRKVCDLTTYLREARFDRFATPDGRRGGTFVAQPGTPQWHRWREYLIATAKPVKFMESQGRQGVGWTCPSEWPPPLPPATMTEQDHEALANEGRQVRERC